ncbi:hypothetical protein [Rhizobium leguminosarum]|nr:hypothetical protein [Rhizobium leguminosarum]MBY5392993.1 hypothetical protein [Rhizobium leguminosarum]
MAKRVLRILAFLHPVALDAADRRPCLGDDGELAVRSVRALWTKKDAVRPVEPTTSQGL